MRTLLSQRKNQRYYSESALKQPECIDYDIFKTYEMCDIPLFSERFVEICNSNNLSGILFEKTQDYDSKNRDFFSREKLIEFFGTDIIK